MSRGTSDGHDWSIPDRGPDLASSGTEPSPSPGYWTGAAENGARQSSVPAS